MTVIGALSSFRKRGEMRPHNALQERFITGQGGAAGGESSIGSLGGTRKHFFARGRMGEGFQGWVLRGNAVHGKHEKRFGEADPNWPD